METNKEKAQKYLNNLDGMGEEPTIRDLQEIIDLASKPDWYYPSKEEFPDVEKGFNCVWVKTKLGYFPLTYSKPGLWFVNSSGNTIKEEDIIAWTYLPKFEEDGSIN